MITPRREPKVTEIDLNQTEENMISAFNAEEKPTEPSTKVTTKKPTSKKKKAVTIEEDTVVPEDSYRLPDDSLRSSDVLTKAALDQAKRDLSNSDAFVPVATSSSHNSDEKIEDFRPETRKRTCKDAIKRVFSCLFN